MQRQRHPAPLARRYLLFLLAAMAAALPAAGAAAAQSAPVAADADWQKLDQRPAHGEQCIVCRQPVYEGDIVELRYKGRSFYVAAGMLGDFEAAPEEYFATLEARAALFDERAVVERSMSRGWLYLGLYVLAGLLCGALAAYLAVSRGLPGLPWFFAGLVGNVVGVLAVLVQRARVSPQLATGVPRGFAKVPTTRSPVACPHCGQATHPAGRRCSHCGAELTPVVEAETARI
jgi:hypothetical protein